MRSLVIILGILVFVGCTKNAKRYQTKVLNNYIENDKKEWLENKLDNNVLYLFFLYGFNNEIIEIDYHNVTLKETSVTTDESLGLATVLVINKNADTNLKIKVSKGTELVFNPFEFESNKIGIYFNEDTLICQPFRYAPTFE
ncbi:hypothetical protein INQ51_08530 [Maribellus sp. CM-23]|uniref:hypothetical protein n=1 Tax=Maribellus sp. CM-23 TaxID=2781026 RepID=UPI001F31A2E1|nr:hypothetical protein [Maribellus sp. CM-23]MCE4564356.1 hypothetical protein [Maribellus sp. CM-23]